MSTLILVTSHGLRPEQTSTFINSLKATAYRGDIGLISNDLKIPGAIQHSWYENQYFRSSRRLFQYKEFLQKHNRRWNKIILTGIRDVLFQSNPELINVEPVSIFTEHDGPTIGTCPYNSKWILNSYGKFGETENKPIICAEIVICDYDGMHYFLDTMIQEAERHERKYDLEDQAMLNWLYWHGKLEANRYHNEYSPVYTVGYCPFVRVSKHLVINESGQVPPVIHQYDRHI